MRCAWTSPSPCGSSSSPRSSGSSRSTSSSSGEAASRFASSLVWSIGWLALGISFTLVVGFWGSRTAGEEYLAGYLIERSLSIDNIFVFALIFGYFAVPIDRAGAAAVDRHRDGARAARRVHRRRRGAARRLPLHDLPLRRAAGRHRHPTRAAQGPGGAPRSQPRRAPAAEGLAGRDRHGGGRGTLATTDIIFAIDSIPAIFAITDDTFIVFAANAFALLGLRSLYFLLAGMMDRFTYLSLGLALVLVWVGAKMLLTDVWKVPTGCPCS